ncbi:class E sortase [Candidatus Dojkabacteria bacterium]|uniref:Class E sortase n=1 Tax=Candidatus Dojkabacteria bacterium TaxID=2099670 RepID=A0A955L8M2_9BACT|nr:class E sortase [Candidatus Dojkabacteria bacterium]
MINYLASILERFFTTKSLQIVNRFLTVFVLLFSSYLVCRPVAQEVGYYVRNNEHKTELSLRDDIEISSNVSREEAERITRSILETSFTEQKTPVLEALNSYLIIPKIGVSGAVLEGTDASTLDQGFWHRPASSNPSEGGNTVITGHRFLYKDGPKTFYHLDKLEIGDEIRVLWEGIDYTYEVESIHEVHPRNIAVEDNTQEPILTLYTCTPLWTAENRLVIRAKLINTK